jgi:hypothetical protein
MRIDLNAIRSGIDSRLARQARWMIGDTPLEFDFSPDRYGLRRVADRDAVGGLVPNEWSGYRLFGVYDYAEGGGASPWIAFRERDGYVCGLDIERQGETVFVFNSSVDCFISTFSLFDQNLRAGQKLPPGFASRAEALDSELFAVSEWRALIERITAA